VVARTFDRGIWRGALVEDSGRVLEVGLIPKASLTVGNSKSSASMRRGIPSVRFAHT
jgi:hypothetical protein